jgi:hypothetical protein
MGIDFTDKIQQITSTYDVPNSFDDDQYFNVRTMKIIGAK